LAPVGAVRSISASRLVAIGLVAVIIAATASLLIAEPSMGPYPLLAVLLGSFAAFGLLLGLDPLRRSLSVSAVLAASGALLLGSAIAPARSSDDLWAYAMYGRAIVEHRANPYVHPPSDFPRDPLLEHVDPYWRGTTARYGPVFIGITATVAVVAGDHPLPTRLAYQMLAALAVFVALVLIARRTRSAAAVAAVGLNPVTAYVVVNAGHNDALIGLAVLVGVLLASRDKQIPATLAFTAAALIKVTAGLGLIAYLVWLAYRRGPRAVLRAAGVAVGVTIPMLLVVGFGNVIGPLLGARESILPHSPWTLLAPGGIRKAVGYGYEDLGSLGHLSTVGIVTAVVVAAIFVVGRRKDTTPLFVVAGALLAYLFASVYTPPWFAAWALPLVALRWRWRVSVCALAFFAVLMIDDRFGNAVFPQVYRHEHSLQVLLANWINTLAMLAAVVSVVVLVLSRHAEPASKAVTPPSRATAET
jgi:alpha-1,6-mannosyltransferase